MYPTEKMVAVDYLGNRKLLLLLFLLSQAFLPGTSLEPTVIPTAQASRFTLQYFPYYV